MIQYVQGNIFSSKAQTLVNPVNTVGVMGKGLAYHFKQHYPITFKKYKKACDANLMKPGMLLLTKENGRYILCFPTKEDWKKPSSLEYIEAGLAKLVSKYEEKGIESIAFPMLGCGCGGLNWHDVRPLMEQYLNQIPIPVFIYIKENDV